LVSLTLVATGAASAQDVFGGIRGTVTHADGAAATGARIALLGTAFGAVADEHGRYAIDHVPVGAYTLQAEFPASDPGEASVRVRAPAGRPGST
jgi:iron complex outermembrane receptor protein